jgi:hypothetical protein
MEHNHEAFLDGWKFFRCTKGKLKIIRKSLKNIEEERVDVKKSVAYWIEKNGLKTQFKELSKKEIRELQTKIDKLNIIKGFPKVVWNYCIFLPDKYRRRKEKLMVERGYHEIFIPKLFMQEYGKKFDGLHGAYLIDGRRSLKLDRVGYYVSEYENNDFREAIYENGDVIKFLKGIYGKEEEWIFSPLIGWNNIPEEAIEEMKNCNCMWAYFGKVAIDENYVDPETGWIDNFYVLKSDGQ